MPATQPDGYLSIPHTNNGEGVLVLHAWWGLNSTIKGICDRLAREGFITFAPDLYHGKIAETIPDAEKYGKALDANYLQAEAEIVEATKYLSERVGKTRHGLDVVSFSLGAYYALNLSDADPEHIRSVVLFYGNGEGKFNQSRAAYLGHFAEFDPYVSAEEVDSLENALKEAGRPVTFYRYKGVGHWFFEPDRKDVYNQAAADLAWERTLAFLKQAHGG